MNTETQAAVSSSGLRWFALIGFGGATALAAWVGSLVTRQATASAWFEQLDKPAFYPPSETFGIVWSVLYVFIALAGWLAWRSGGGSTTTVPWAIQLTLNLGWTLVFFGARAPVWSLLEIVLLMAAIIWTATVFSRYDKWATILFIPYILWVGFATVLTAAIVLSN